MNSIVKSCSAVFVFLLCVLLMALFRIVPVSKIWSHYSVLYVEDTISEEQVLDVLSAKGCSDVLALSLQQVPFVSTITLVRPLSSNYLNRRSDYFFDQTKTYRLFYIPASQEKQTAAALSLLQNELHLSAGVDGSLQYPFVVPLVSMLVFGLLIFLAHNRLVFFTAGLAPVLCSFCVPLYPAAAAIILFLAALFFAERLWLRQGTLMALVRSVYIDVLVIVPLVIMSLLSGRAIILYVLSLIACAAAIYGMWCLTQILDSKKAFTFVPIFSAFQIPVMGKKKSYVLISLTLPLAALLLFFLLSARFMPSSSVQSICIPSPLEDSDGGETLVNMTDYFSWAWDTVTFPYKNLNKNEKSNPSDGDRIEIPRYVKTEQGVSKSYETIFTYDASFRKELIDGILDSESPAIEKLLLSEGSSVRVGYRTKAQAKTSTDSVALVLILVALSIPVLLYAYYYFVGSRRI